MKKITRFFIIFLIIFLIINTIYLYSYISNADWQDSITQAGTFIETGESLYNEDITGSITDEFVGIGQLLTYIGAGVFVCVVTYMGINYLISSPDKQAVLKQQLIGVVVAGVVIFGAYGIWSAILKIVSTF